MKKVLLTTLRLLAFMTILTGLVYPLFVTGIARLVFPFQSGGSIVWRDGSAAGSILLGQVFTRDSYFHSRPSACDYSAMASGGSNLSPTSHRLTAVITKRKALWTEGLPSGTPIPADLLTASASGLDPHISPGAARIQLDRVAGARHYNDMDRKMLEDAIDLFTEKRTLGFIGEERVNVLLLNMFLDGRETR